MFMDFSFSFYSAENKYAHVEHKEDINVQFTYTV